MTKNKRGEIVAALLLDVEELTLLVAALMSLHTSGALDEHDHSRDVLLRISEQLSNTTDLTDLN
jgi:hypothetical protein